MSTETILGASLSFSINDLKSLLGKVGQEISYLGRAIRNSVNAIQKPSEMHKSAPLLIDCKVVNTDFIFFNLNCRILQGSLLKLNQTCALSIRQVNDLAYGIYRATHQIRDLIAPLTQLPQLSVSKTQPSPQQGTPALDADSKTGVKQAQKSSSILDILKAKALLLKDIWLGKGSRVSGIAQVLGVTPEQGQDVSATVDLLKGKSTVLKELWQGKVGKTSGVLQLFGATSEQTQSVSTAFDLFKGKATLLKDIWQGKVDRSSGIKQLFTLTSEQKQAISATVDLLKGKATLLKELWQGKVGKTSGILQLFGATPEQGQAVSATVDALKNKATLIKDLWKGQVGKISGGLQLLGVDSAQAEKFSSDAIAVKNKAVSLGSTVKKVATSGFKKIANSAPIKRIAAAPKAIKDQALSLGSGIKKVAVSGLEKMPAALNFAKQKASSFGGTLQKLASSGLDKAGKAVSGLGMVFQSIGRTLMTNPIVLIIGAIAIAALLIYKYWEPIKAFFKKLWDKVKEIFQSIWGPIKKFVSNIWEQIKSAFSGGIGKIAQLLLNWSPLGLFYKAFSGVMSYFKVELPGSFSSFGKMLMDGLINGITAKITAIKDTITNLADSIGKWFSEKLGIHSPSRIFMNFGGNIGAGAQLGITQSTPKVQGAVGKLANTAVAGAQGISNAAWAGVAGATQAAQKSLAPRAAPSAPAGNGMVLHFSPNIQVRGNVDDGDAGAIKKTLQLSLRELEQMLRKLHAEQQRRAFA